MESFVRLEVETTLVTVLFAYKLEVRAQVGWVVPSTKDKTLVPHIWGPFMCGVIEEMCDFVMMATWYASILYWFFLEPSSWISMLLCGSHNCSVLYIWHDILSCLVDYIYSSCFCPQYLSVHTEYYNSFPNYYTPRIKSGITLNTSNTIIGNTKKLITWIILILVTLCSLI